jgi:hypothetical protein
MLSKIYFASHTALHSAPPHPPGGEPHHNSHRHPHQLVLHSGPLDHTTNWPLKGGKHTFWDGGVRVVAGVGGGLVPAKRRGSTWAGLAHSADWFRTVAEGLAKATFAKNATGPIDDDSFKNHLSYILLSYTPLIHSSHTLLSYTPLIQVQLTTTRSISGTRFLAMLPRRGTSWFIKSYRHTLPRRYRRFE